MEIKQGKTVWLDPEHPNYERWRHGRSVAKERAEIVNKIISQYKHCEDLNILDLGSGEGGTSTLMAESNNVISYDLSLIRLKRQLNTDQKYLRINGTAELLPLRTSMFDLIILQDVIEHIQDRKLLVKEISRVLKNNGIIYLSTPNKYSIFNIISDPHWGIPFLSLLKRSVIKKYFLHLFRPEDYERNDLAELLQLEELGELFKDYHLHLETKKIINLLSEGHKGILWSSFHLFLYKFLTKFGLLRTLKKIVNNKPGLFNKLLTPTFYIILDLKAAN